MAGLGAAAAAGLGLLGINALTGGSAKKTGTTSTGKAAADAHRATLEHPPVMANAPVQPPVGHNYDLVIKGGRVVDPDSGFDAVAFVGIDGTSVTAISKTPLTGTQTIDATNRVVAPGFIDLLSYEPDDYGARYKIADGVTTNLGMHGLNYPAAQFLSRYDGNCMVNFGGALRHPSRREDLCRLNAGQSPNARQIQIQVDDLEKQLHDGWLGIDFEPEYCPGTTMDEMVALATVAKKYDLICTFHGRYSSYTDGPKTIDEIIEVAKATGARVHVEHIISTGGTWHMAESLKKLSTARTQGYDISACMYPYNFWATTLGTPRFNAGWQDRFHITYSDLEIAGSKERLTESTFAKYRAENKLAAAFAIPEDDVRTCLKDPTIMIGSDAILTPGNNNHPRAAGCFSRTLGRYARDESLISLPDALARMTILPARRFSTRAPVLARKGRIQRGSDADITIFDPKTIIDRSTVENPAQEAVGVDWVIINGQIAKTPNGVADIKPGIAIRSQI